MEYMAYREKYVEMDRICKEEEADVVDRFLVEKYGTNKFDPDELYIFRWFLNNYKDKMEDGNLKQYREIIEVFLELDRAPQRMHSICHGLYVQVFFEKYLTRIIRFAILNIVHIEVIV